MQACSLHRFYHPNVNGINWNAKWKMANHVSNLIHMTDEEK